MSGDKILGYQYISDGLSLPQPLSPLHKAGRGRALSRSGTRAGAVRSGAQPSITIGSQSQSSSGATAIVTTASPYQNHKRILGWKLTSPERRMQMIRLLEGAPPRPPSPSKQLKPKPELGRGGTARVSLTQSGLVIDDVLSDDDVGVSLTSAAVRYSSNMSLVLSRGRGSRPPTSWSADSKAKRQIVDREVVLATAQQHEQQLARASAL